MTLCDWLPSKSPGSEYQRKSGPRQTQGWRVSFLPSMPARFETCSPVLHPAEGRGLMKAPPFHGLTFQTGVPGAQPSPARPSRSVTAARPTSNTPARGREAGKPEETFSCLSSACLLATGSHPETGRPGQHAARVHRAPDRCPPTRQAAGAALPPGSRRRRWEGLPSFPSRLMLQ